MRARWLGRVPYAEAWDLQRAIAARSGDDYLLLLEHGPVYTLGVNADRSHVLVDPASVGADLVEVDRGGDVTVPRTGTAGRLPGPLASGAGPHRGPEHVRQVEEVVIEAAGRASAWRRNGWGGSTGYPGVWVDPSAAGAGADGPRKIAAIGVRHARGRTTHGFALNVTTDLVDVRAHRAVRDRRPTGHLAGRRGSRRLHGRRGGGRARRRTDRCGARSTTSPP